MKIIVTESIPQSLNSTKSLVYTDIIPKSNISYDIRIDGDDDIKITGPFRAKYLSSKSFRKYLREGIIKIVIE